MSTSAKTPSWPGYIGTLNLLLLTIAVPIVCFGGAVFSAPWFGEITPADRVEQFTWFVGGTVSAGLAIVVAIVVAIAGTKGTRILAGVTIPLAFVGLVFMGYLSVGSSRSLPENPAAAQPAEPTCGPDSRPPVYGGDSRYRPCDADLRLATDLVPTITAELPVEGVTRASVEAAATRLEADGVTGLEGVVAVDEEVIVVTWMAAPVTCIVAVWSDGAWQTSVDGLLVDGGCGLPGVDPRYNSD